MYDLLAICYADESYSLAEKNSLRTIANILGIETAKLVAMEDVMHQNVKLHEKINAILEK